MGDVASVGGGSGVGFVGGDEIIGLLESFLGSFGWIIDMDQGLGRVGYDSAIKEMTRMPESKGGCRVDSGRVRLGVDSVNSAEFYATRPVDSESDLSRVD